LAPPAVLPWAEKKSKIEEKAGGELKKKRRRQKGTRLGEAVFILALGLGQGLRR
jgi:hypothetical protein